MFRKSFTFVVAERKRVILFALRGSSSWRQSKTQFQKPQRNNVYTQSHFKIICDGNAGFEGNELYNK
jgi:hypothetical protein